MSKAEVITLGCRLNAYESEVVRAHARAAGLDETVIVNTCAVTGEAVRQARQTIRRVKRQRPDVRIVVTGCAAQIDPQAFAALPEVDRVLGNAEKMQAASYRGLLEPGGEPVLVDDIMAVRETAGHLIDGFAARARAYVQVQNGCDHRCTFCIIPYGRGNSRSVPAGEVVHQIRHLVENGTREVVLTGVDITSYGPDLPGNMTLGKLVLAVLRQVPELERLRLSSIDSIEVDPALMEAIASETRLMPHLHLSLQAGDDMILKRMRRRHSRDDSIRFCEAIRAVRPDVVFGADLIAGFPTETEEMFENTLRLVAECGLTWLHVFAFSPRDGTPAARMPQVLRVEIKQRAARLRACGEVARDAWCERQVGRLTEVLVERDGVGRTPQFAAILLGEGVADNAIVMARVTGLQDGRLKGVVA